MNLPDVVLATCRGVRLLLAAVVLGLMMADLVSRTERAPHAGTVEAHAGSADPASR